MDSSALIVLLPLVTFAAVLGFAWWSKKKTEDRRADDSAPKSTLAADTPDSR